MELTTHIEPSLVPTYLELEYEASAAYYDFVYDDEAEARRAQRILWDACAGEWVPPHGHAAMSDGKFVGLIGGVMAGDLQRVRLGASMTLGRAGILSDGDRVERMRMAVKTLVKPREGDFYVGQIAITPAARKTGIAEESIDLFRQYAYARGARRMVFQANADSARLIAFYERSGQRERVGEGQATDAKTGRTLHYIHFATDLAKWRRWRERRRTLAIPAAIRGKAVARGGRLRSSPPAPASRGSARAAQGRRSGRAP